MSPSVIIAVVPCRLMSASTSVMEDLFEFTSPVLPALLSAYATAQDVKTVRHEWLLVRFRVHLIQTSACLGARPMILSWLPTWRRPGGNAKFEVIGYMDLCGSSKDFLRLMSGVWE